MKDNFVAQEKVRLKDNLKKINEQIGLLDRYQELIVDVSPAKALKALNLKGLKALKALNEEKTPKSVPADGDAPKKSRGRPKGSKNKPKAVGDVTTVVTVPAGDGKPIDLMTLLVTLGSQVNKPLHIADFVNLALKNGYVSKAKDFPNIVYQALLKLTKETRNGGTFVKNKETRAFEFVAA